MQSRMATPPHEAGGGKCHCFWEVFQAAIAIAMFVLGCFGEAGIGTPWWCATMFLISGLSLLILEKKHSVPWEDETKPEDCIPDVPGNEHAREFLAHAPTKGLWMPLGKEVKVMQCWRCKRYGHRTGDKECPFFIKGNQKLEQFRVAHEDPMYDVIRENKRHEKEMRIQQLKQLLEDSTSDEDESSGSSSSSECKEKHKKKKKKEKKKKEKKKKKKRKHKSSKSNERSESD
ncbi:Retinitis pigmentosa 9 protein [Chelonia mydas]|uniref:Retinitis pigmentosa 9 protein n=1 Tax=Chelonia mydas TaxID=8469 RepID=M7B112_CHEMY|nr:Retinitis pigmentosa 9 protein [Chelonia mydas]